MSRRAPVRRNIERTGARRGPDYGALIRAARAARRRAYAPYSHFPVGAAALASDGSIYTGANVENASFGLTQCAERVALQTAVASGRRRIRAVAVAAPAGTTPCGACRQVMAEFGVRTVVLAGPGGAPTVLPFAELLPRAFGARALAGYRARSTARTPSSRVGRRRANRAGL
jgi:cytidine deaminase